MTLIPYIPTIICILGAIAYLVIKNNSEAKDIGRWCFILGLAAVLVQIVGGIKLP